MAATGMHNLTTLIKRLEAATSRLEDIASTSSDGSKPGFGSSAAAVSRAASINSDASVPPNSAVPTPAAPKPVDLPPSIMEFDSAVIPKLDSLDSLTKELASSAGETVVDAESVFSAAFRAQRRALLFATKSRTTDVGGKPFVTLMEEILAGYGKLDKLESDNFKKEPQYNYIRVLRSALSTVGWMQMPKVKSQITDTKENEMQTYANTIMKGTPKDSLERKWVAAAGELLVTLSEYAKEHHGNGLAFNPKGIDPEEALKEVQSDATATGIPGTGGPSHGVAAPSAGGPPPPPPPPPPMPPAFEVPDAKQQQASSSGDMGAVFGEINRGESVTSGLKKVDKSQMTHKNPSLRAQAPAAPQRSESGSPRGKSPAPNKKPDSMRTKKPGKKELDGNKWIVEQFDSQQTPLEIDAEKQHSILVTKCKSTNLIVHGKANAISVDSCTRCNIIIDSLVAQVEVVNCSNFQLQVNGSLPAVQLDKVDSATIFLSKESIHSEIYTSKCSSINITLPPASDDDDSVELPVPEQIKTSIVDGKLVNEIVKQEG